MTTLTLSYSDSYRAITDADNVTDQDTFPFMQPIAVGFGGNGIIEDAVTLTGPGGPVIFPSVDLSAGLPEFFVAHSPFADHIDLINASNFDLPFLRFQVSVEPPPIWENYVHSSYKISRTSDYLTDKAAFDAALADWTQSIATAYMASTATIMDIGGIVGHYTSSGALLFRDFAETATFYATVITGSAFGDNFSGGELSDTLYGGNGDDILSGLGGNDMLFGDDGFDVLYGAAGADFMRGSTGADVLYGGDGNDGLEGNAGDDTLDGGLGSDELKGGDDNDLMHGGTANDGLFGGDGADLIYGEDGDDKLFGGAGNDVLNAGAGNDTLTGGTEDDGLSGGDGNDSLIGGDGADFLRGGFGRDTLAGNAGNDTFNFNSLGPLNADKIMDFVRGDDRIALSTVTFSEVHAALDAQEFRLGTAAQDGDDRIIYDQATGRLWYDPDGTLHGASSAPQVLFAIVANHVALTFNDFQVI